MRVIDDINKALSLIRAKATRVCIYEIPIQSEVEKKAWQRF